LMCSLPKQKVAFGAANGLVLLCCTLRQGVRSIDIELPRLTASKHSFSRSYQN
jgi:hypothetical protein